MTLLFITKNDNQNTIKTSGKENAFKKKTTKKHTVSTPRYRVTQNDCKDKEDHREAHNDGTDMQTFQQNYIRQVQV